MEERRSSRRYSVSLPAKAVIAATKQVCQGMVTDISFSGVRFVCEENIEKDQQLDVTFFIEEQELTLKARVVWSASLDDPKNVNHGLQVVGVVFDGDTGVFQNRM